MTDQPASAAGRRCRTRAPRAVAAGLLALLLVMFASPAFAEINLDSAKSAHYTVHTNADRVFATELARHMDAVFKEYSRRFSSFGGKRNGRMDLYLLDTQEQYIQFLADQGFSVSNSGGIFAVTPKFSGLVTWVQERPRSQTLKVLQHEGFHQFAFNFIGRDLPMWANEGLAQYFEDGIMINGRMRLGVPDSYRMAMVKQALANNALVPFDTLLSMNSQQWLSTLQQNPERSALLYAQSWSIVYFLIHARDGRYRPALEKYLRMVAEGVAPEDAFGRAFGGSDTSDMQARWREAVQSMEPDPLSVAVTNLEYLAQGILALREAGAETPNSFSELETALRRGQFHAVRVMHGMSFTITAEDDTLFQYIDAKGRRMPFQMLQPEAKGYPPRLTAPKVQPQPVLEWRKDAEGAFIPEIAWR